MKDKKKRVAKSYINNYAAYLLMEAGHEVKMQDGSIWKAEPDTNYGFAEYTRSRHFQGLPAKERLMFINDKSWFLARYTKIGHNSPIIPIDFWGGIPEQLVDTQRIASSPQTDAKVDETRDNWATMFGSEMYVHHLERQVDLPIEVIRQYLYDPDFVNRVEDIFQTEIGNDLTRLAVNGKDYSYTDKDFYNLLKGYFTILKEAKGMKTLPSGVSMFSGRFGQYVTPVKIDAPKLRFVTPLEDKFGADSSALYTPSAGSLAVTGGKLLFTSESSWTGGNFVYNNIIPVLMNTRYQASLKIKSTKSKTGNAYIAVLNPAGDTIATSNTVTFDNTAEVVVNVAFGTYNNTGIRLKVVCSQTSQDNGFSIDDIKVDRAVKRFQFPDILAILDKMIDNHNPEYDTVTEPHVFLMGKEDAALLAEGQRVPLYITEDGERIPFGTERRDIKLEFGQTNLDHRGYRIVIVPYAKSLNRGGWIIFGPDTTEFRIGFQNIFSYERKYSSRMKKGGEGYKYTYHFYQSFGIRVPGKFVIAEGIGSDLTCEDLVIGTSKTNCGSRIGSSATAITYSVGNNESGFVFCDTPGSMIYYADDADKLADIDTAEAQATLYEGKDLTKDTIVTNGNHTFFRAFLPDCAQPSKILDITGAA